MMNKCELVPLKIKEAVESAVNNLFVKQIQVYALHVLRKIHEIIISVTCFDILDLLKWITILSVVIWLFNFVTSVFKTYLCWLKLKCLRSSSSSSSKSKTSKSSDSSSSHSCGC